jgi:putative glutamine amidotransferase
MTRARSRRKPVIGVTTQSGAPDWVEKNSQNYINILGEYGAVPTVLSPDYPAVLPDGEVFYPDERGCLPEAVLACLDGLLLSGGGDVHPRYFGQTVAGADPDSINLKRDELEVHLARQALSADLPLFGVCRGCQVLNVAAGGGMVQHLDGHRSSKESPRLHDVTICAESRLYRLILSPNLAVNTYHHQGIDETTLAPLLRISATAQPETWLIEAYESPFHRWAVGVQWHPERIFELPDAHRRLWESFLEAACED